MKRYPRIIAHRCGGALAPENTLAGLRLAARLGCRGVEFDAMLSADGVPVLMHDEALDRTTDGQGPVALRSAADLARCDAGLRHHRAFVGEPLPTLREALATCAEFGLWANVEIKPSAGVDAATGHVVATVAASFDNLVLSSFSVEALCAAAATAPTVPRAMLFDRAVPDYVADTQEVGAIAAHLAGHLLTTEVAAALYSAELGIACYTINNRKEAERLFALGAVAVFTDRPDLWSVAEM